MNSLYESILSSTHSGREQLIKEKMAFISKNCEPVRDYSITKDGVEIYGICTSLNLGRNFDRTGFYFSKIEPAGTCRINLKSENGKYLPKVLGKEGKSKVILVLGITSDNVSYKDLPEMVYGDIEFRGGNTLDISEIPNCSGDILIMEKEYNKVIYPKGFPVKSTKILIYRD